MTLWILILGLLLLPLLPYIVVFLRLQLPVVYLMLFPTIFRPWYLAHTQWAERGFYGLVALTALSWLVTLARFLWDTWEDWSVDRATVDTLKARVRQARASGETVVNTDGLWL